MLQTTTSTEPPPLPIARIEEILVKTKSLRNLISYVEFWMTVKICASYPNETKECCNIDKLPLPLPNGSETQQKKWTELENCNNFPLPKLDKFLVTSYYRNVECPTSECKTQMSVWDLGFLIFVLWGVEDERTLSSSSIKCMIVPRSRIEQRKARGAVRCE